MSEVQEKRREVGNHLKDIRQKSLELQDQLHKLKRQNDMDRFLELMREETEVSIRLQKQVHYASRIILNFQEKCMHVFLIFPLNF